MKDEQVHCIIKNEIEWDVFTVDDVSSNLFIKKRHCIEKGFLRKIKEEFTKG